IWPAIAALAAVTLVACGGDDPTPTQATPSAPVTSPPNTGVAESEQNTFLKIAPTDKVLNDVKAMLNKPLQISISK
ncbi:hypothetical protein V4C53_47740, partial [Paraburkholderia azotifigens]